MRFGFRSAQIAQRASRPDADAGCCDATDLVSSRHPLTDSPSHLPVRDLLTSRGGSHSHTQSDRSERCQRYRAIRGSRDSASFRISREPHAGLAVSLLGHGVRLSSSKRSTGQTDSNKRARGRF
ncbi:uncharacterized protein L969DRAFT_385113 [Mixia osmundae IAM 14324]|uniref:uncharacterized protein n=1 Tax=Mixia osmundae (strain CBS 9802 / IAM 14324 / JCM 22182 / KY 12970) TaxID=764103 RepID=UPI0004A54F2B|nr:uncharacterized protein L969DRAFT_385113 [Mixia osmundae IAM 14324]KEI39871.1 hypothetical protein L969DRAFT_385113 [Mixia osmundae IAM 14324]